MLEKLREYSPPRPCPRPPKRTDVMRKKWKKIPGRRAFISQSGLPMRLACKQHERGSPRREHHPTSKERPASTGERKRGKGPGDNQQLDQKGRPKKPCGGLRDEHGFNYLWKRARSAVCGCEETWCLQMLWVPETMFCSLQACGLFGPWKHILLK